jgi:(2R)-3-sulfolactate dehydrogenase (NADP+)
VQAEERGHRLVGVAHLPDYADGFRAGRITGGGEPSIRRYAGSVSIVDCAGGLAQHGYERVADQLAADADRHGLAAAALANSFTAGELGYYVRQVTARGQLAIACANSPALMSVVGARGPMLGTNPLAYGLPLPDGRTVLVDQASSATAWVALRDAATREEPIDPAWAVDAAGQPTTSATAGLAGALLPFGGYKGGNIAFLVELLATAAGGLFSSDAPPFDHGHHSPRIGVVVVAVSLATLAPGYGARLLDQFARWEADLGADTSVWIEPDPDPTCGVPEDLYARLVALAEAQPHH